MAEHVVKLSRRYEPPAGQPFDSVVLREPTYVDTYMDGLGIPEEWQPNGQGGGMLITYPTTIDAYLQRLVKVGSPGYENLALISSLDGKKLADKVLGFFREAAATTSPPTTSSSGSDGTQPASSE
ncbi:hypothetical protein [Rhizobium cremeum]|uniref:hypothetical protein n=1 Tax=Rhizobium cremeum TaxID=2813827 RepID=UPI0039E06F83